MLTTGRELTMQGSVVGPVKLHLGSKTFEHYLYVAPIENNMLPGLDVLKQLEVKLDMSKDELVLGSEKLPLYLGESSCEPMVASHSSKEEDYSPEFSNTHSMQTKQTTFGVCSGA